MRYRFDQVTPYPANEPSITTQLHHVHVDHGLELEVAVADARAHESHDTVLFFLPWSEYVARPDASDRYRLLATALSARVIALDNLGMGGQSSRLPASMLRDVSRGDFGGVVGVQMEALRQLDVSLARVGLMGFSLGTSMAACFARSMQRDETVQSLTLVEPVGMTRQSTLRLMSKFAADAIGWGKNYSEMHGGCPAWMHTPGEYIGTARQALGNSSQYMAYPRGLATAPLLGDINEAYGGSIQTDTPIRVASGSASKISTLAEDNLLVENLRRLGLEQVTHDIYEGVSHGVLDLPRKIIPIMAPHVGGVVEVE